MTSHTQDAGHRTKPSRAPAPQARINATTALLHRPDMSHAPGDLLALGLTATTLLTAATVGGIALGVAAFFAPYPLSLAHILAASAILGVLAAAGAWYARKAWRLERAHARAQRSQERIQRVIAGLSHATLERASGLLLARWLATGPDHLPKSGVWSFTLEWTVDRHGCTPHRIHLVPRRDTGARATPSKRMAPPYPLTNPGILHRHGGAHIAPAVAAPHVAPEDWEALPTGRRQRQNGLRFRVRLHPIAFDTAHQRLALRAFLHDAFPPFYNDAHHPPRGGHRPPEAAAPQPDTLQAEAPHRSGFDTAATPLAQGTTA